MSNIPNRKCVACFKVVPKTYLDRYVNKDGCSILDNKKELKGRGIYVCKDNINCLNKAIKKGKINVR